MEDIIPAVASPLQAKRTGFLQWRLGHDHGLGSRDIADAFGLPVGDALAMLRGDQPVPEYVVAAGKAAVNSWHREGHVGDIRQHLRREAAALALQPLELLEMI